ncbi:hypothetical protein FB451DRAFT_1535696, partial [Mycena latifolia]
ETLQRKLVVAIAERDKQIKAFEEVTATVEPEVQASWLMMIEEWLEDGSKPNPFTLSRKVRLAFWGDADADDIVSDCPSEAEVRLQVRKDEDSLTAGGKASLYGQSATAFLVAGIQIEDAQRRILASRGETALVAADRENKIEEWWRSALVKIARFRSLQKIYMPGAAAAIVAAEALRDPELHRPSPRRSSSSCRVKWSSRATTTCYGAASRGYLTWRSSCGSRNARTRWPRCAHAF